jgi:hypothetical protein
VSAMVAIFIPFYKKRQGSAIPDERMDQRH